MGDEALVAYSDFDLVVITGGGVIGGAAGGYLGAGIAGYLGLSGLSTALVVGATSGTAEYIGTYSVASAASYIDDTNIADFSTIAAAEYAVSGAAFSVAFLGVGKGVYFAGAGIARTALNNNTGRALLTASAIRYSTLTFNTTVSAGQAASRFSKLGLRSLAGFADDVASKRGISKNSLDYIGDTHVYRIKGPNGTYKIGESAQGVRVRDGASIRGEEQARRFTKETGDFYESEIRKTFPDKRSARTHETRTIELFRRIFGEDALPGNKNNR